MDGTIITRIHDSFGPVAFDPQGKLLAFAILKENGLDIRRISTKGVLAKRDNSVKG